jgi:hypothetical protein
MPVPEKGLSGTSTTRPGQRGIQRFRTEQRTSTLVGSIAITGQNWIFLLRHRAQVEDSVLVT